LLLAVIAARFRVIGHRGEFAAENHPENRDEVPTIFGGFAASCCYQPDRIIA